MYIYTDPVVSGTFTVPVTTQDIFTASDTSYSYMVQLLYSSSHLRQINDDLSIHRSSSSSLAQRLCRIYLYSNTNHPTQRGDMSY